MNYVQGMYVVDVDSLKSDSAAIQVFSLFTLRTRALLENMRFSAFVIAIVFVSYVGYGMRHGMDDDKEEPGWWLKRHPAWKIRVCPEMKCILYTQRGQFSWEC